MNLAELGARIRHRREERGLRQSDVAAALRISAQAVSKWERGENAPDIAVLVRLCKLLDVRCEWLLGGGPVEDDTFEAAVFATSIAGFAAQSIARAPSELAAWTNAVHFVVTEAVREFEGVPVKFVGDGALAFFTGPDMERRAFAAARRALATSDTDLLAVAVHAGPIYLGRIGHPDYAALDVLGAAVNRTFMMLPVVHERCESRIGVTAQIAQKIDEDLLERGVLATPDDRTLALFEG